MRLPLSLLLILLLVGCGSKDPQPASTEGPASEGTHAEGSHAHEQAAPSKQVEAVESVDAATEQAAEAVQENAAETEAAVQQVVAEVVEVVADVAAAADIEAMLAVAKKQLDEGKLDALTAELAKLGEMELTDEQKALLQQLIDGAKKLGAAALATQLSGEQGDGNTAPPDAEAVKDAAKKAAANALGGALFGTEKKE
jgi:hypothetical protein